jgi:hypothetical protein
MPVRDEVVWDVEKIYASHQTRVLRLDDFTHLLAKLVVCVCLLLMIKILFLYRDLVPIVAVLKYSQWFNGIIIDNLKLVRYIIRNIVITNV